MERGNGKANITYNGSAEELEMTGIVGSCVNCGNAIDASMNVTVLKVTCEFCDSYIYYPFCSPMCSLFFRISADAGTVYLTDEHACPSVPGGCTECDGTGEKTTTITCPHGYTTTHSYCSHGYTTQHD